MPVNHAKEYLIFVHIGVVFLHFLARASNGRQYSNFENKCPKLGTGTPEDMVLTNLGDSLDSDPSGFVLLCMAQTREPAGCHLHFRSSRASASRHF